MSLFSVRVIPRSTTLEEKMQTDNIFVEAVSRPPCFLCQVFFTVSFVCGALFLPSLLKCVLLTAASEQGAHGVATHNSPAAGLAMTNAPWCSVQGLVSALLSLARVIRRLRLEGDTQVAWNHLSRAAGPTEPRSALYWQKPVTLINFKSITLIS